MECKLSHYFYLTDLRFSNRIITAWDLEIIGSKFCGIPVVENLKVLGHFFLEKMS